MASRVFSGIQPSGTIHIGNYIGAIRSWVELQEKYDSFFCIVDYHALTVPYNAKELPMRVKDAVATNVAAGLDPNKATIFIQSQVPEHVELSWFFTCITPIGQLERMTQFKAKAEQHRGAINAGLMDYPILQAADILIYKADLVPVGEDQVQHIELTRDIARRFNNTFGETFPEPEVYLNRGARIMALNDPEVKMSKSLPGSYVALVDDPEEIKKKIRRAVTDTGPTPGQMSPGVKNLFTILESFAPESVVQSFRDDYENQALRYSELKQTVADYVIEHLTPIRERRNELLSKPKELDEIVQAGAERARKIAREILQEVRDKMGLRSSLLD